MRFKSLLPNLYQQTKLNVFSVPASNRFQCVTASTLLAAGRLPDKEDRRRGSPPAYRLRTVRSMLRFNSVSVFQFVGPNFPPAAHRDIHRGHWQTLMRSFVGGNRWRLSRQRRCQSARAAGVALRRVRGAAQLMMKVLLRQTHQTMSRTSNSQAIHNRNRTYLRYNFCLRDKHAATARHVFKSVTG